jgi:stearoyl-CoA desaturase (delta-9 desaturase)
MIFLDGIFSLPIWGYVLYALVLTHITIVSVTLFLHRHQAHRSLWLHPICSHFFRFWLWLTTGMLTREWVAIHRKHHAEVETELDPHSPSVHGVGKVLWEGTELYRKESLNAKTLQDYGHETPDDWVERNVYSKYTMSGIGAMLVINFILLGFAGVSIWAVQMMWIPFFAAGVINGIGHWGGYRNFETQDASTNIVPWGIVIGGEELHNNHHAFASSAKFSCKWWEFDIGWLYIRALAVCGLARVKTRAPTLLFNFKKIQIDHDTVGAVIANRLQVMAEYASRVITTVYNQESAKAMQASGNYVSSDQRLLRKADNQLDPKARQRLAVLLEQHDALKVVYGFRQRLQELWLKKSATRESLLADLQEWCHQAEASGIEALQEFAHRLRGYTLQPV